LSHLPETASPGSAVGRRQEMLTQLGTLEALVTNILDRHRGTDLAALAEDLSALRERVATLRVAVESNDRVESEARHLLAHDLRAPLNAMAGWAQVLRLEKGTDDTVKHAVQVFERSISAMAKVIGGYTG